MRTLVQFFIKHLLLIVFLSLEFVSIFLVVRSNSYQHAKYLTASNYMVGSLYQTTGRWRSFFFLEEENKRLIMENTHLLNSQVYYYDKHHSGKFFFRDTIFRQRYVFSDAEVINNTTHRMRNYITLDKGGEQGVKPGMGVMSSTGVVGIVKEVSPHFSTVMSVLNVAAKYSAKIERNGSFGSLEWDGVDPNYAILKDIPAHVQLKKNDRVTTSGYSLVFPEGVHIGKVESFNKNETGDFYFIKVRLSVDFHSVTHVNLVENLFKNEQNTLEERTIEDEIL